MYCVGIDVAKFKHSLAVISGGGEIIIERYEFANSKSGFDALLEKLKSEGISGKTGQVCMEPTGHYGRNAGTSYGQGHKYL